MRRKLFILTVLVFLVVLSGCSKETDSLQEIKEEVNIISKEHNDINVTVNPNIELLSIVQYLSNYNSRTGLMTKFDIEYKSDVDEYFEKYKNHKAVEFFDKMSQNNFTYDAPPTVMLYLDSKLNKKNNVNYTEYLLNRAGGEKNIEKFVSLLRDFYIDTNFQKFFNAHADYYNDIIDETIENMGNHNYIKELESYYGLKQNSYNIVLASLFHPGGFGPKVEVDKNKYDIYSIIGPQGIQNGKPVFGNEEGFKYLQRHEFSHSFVNYLADIHEDELMKYEKLFTPIKEPMSAMAYSDWKTCVNEHIVRAVTTRMAFNDGEEEGEEALAYEEGNKFIYVEELVNKLYEYENNREEYETFEEFYPELIKAFDKYLNNKDLIEEKLSLYKSINDAIFDGDIIIVIPTNEKSKNNEIKEYANSINNAFKLSEKIISDETALEMDLSKYNVLIYGTIEGNKLLSKYKDEFPFTMKDNSIAINGKEYSGEKIQFITVVKNLQNPKKSFIIYTSNKEDNILNINDNFHGPSAYHLYIDGKEVLNGFY